jgi:hypothetical protein
MDAYTASLLSIVALSIVAITVHKVNFRLRLFKFTTLDMDKEESTSSAGNQVTKRSTSYVKPRRASGGSGSAPIQYSKNRPGKHGTKR